jgi:hypothetical protein
LKMKWTKIACVVVLGFFFAQPLFADPSTLKRVIPTEMESQGWKAEDEPLFASDEATLSLAINGAAPRYMELGTRKAVFVTYERDGIYLMLEIYETDLEKNSEKIYAEFALDTSVPMENLGTKARLTKEMGGTFMLEYFQDRFYVRMSITQKSEEAKKVILACAETVSGRIAKMTGKKIR